MQNREQPLKNNEQFKGTKSFTEEEKRNAIQNFYQEKYDNIPLSPSQVRTLKDMSDSGITFDTKLSPKEWEIQKDTWKKEREAEEEQKKALNQEAKEMTEGDKEKVQEILKKINPDTTKKTFQENSPFLNEAEEVLKDPEKRSILKEIGIIAGDESLAHHLANALEKLNNGQIRVNIPGQPAEDMPSLDYFFERDTLESYKKGDPEIVPLFEKFIELTK